VFSEIQGEMVTLRAKEGKKEVKIAKDERATSEGKVQACME